MPVKSHCGENAKPAVAFWADWKKVRATGAQSIALREWDEMRVNHGFTRINTEEEERIEAG